MIFEYTGRHIDVTPALRSHAEEHFNKIGHALKGKATKAHIILGVEHGRHRSEVVLNWDGDVLTAATTNSDMYQSISLTIDKIGKQALKSKDKIIEKYHRADKKNALFLNKDQESDLVSTPRIVTEKQRLSKPVTAEEAAILLANKKKEFLLFRNAENERISLIYKRKDGNYGLIET